MSSSLSLLVARCCRRCCRFALSFCIRRARLVISFSLRFLSLLLVSFVFCCRSVGAACLLFFFLLYWSTLHCCLRAEFTMWLPFAAVDRCTYYSAYMHNQCKREATKFAEWMDGAKFTLLWHQQWAQEGKTTHPRRMCFGRKRRTMYFRRIFFISRKHGWASAHVPTAHTRILIARSTLLDSFSLSAIVSIVPVFLWLFFSSTSCKARRRASVFAVCAWWLLFIVAAVCSETMQAEKSMRHNNLKTKYSKRKYAHWTMLGVRVARSRDGNAREIKWIIILWLCLFIM